MSRSPPKEYTESERKSIMEGLRKDQAVVTVAIDEYINANGGATQDGTLVSLRIPTTSYSMIRVHEDAAWIIRDVVSRTVAERIETIFMRLKTKGNPGGGSE